MTENEWLADRHRRHGYKEVDESGTPSFYQIKENPCRRYLIPLVKIVIQSWKYSENIN